MPRRSAGRAPAGRVRAPSGRTPRSRRRGDRPVRAAERASPRPPRERPRRRHTPPEAARPRATRPALSGTSAPGPSRAAEAWDAPPDAHQARGRSAPRPTRPRRRRSPRAATRARPVAPAGRGRTPVWETPRRQLTRNRIPGHDHAELDELAAARHVALGPLADRLVTGSGDDAHQRREHDHGIALTNVPGGASRREPTRIPVPARIDVVRWLERDAQVRSR